MIKLIAHRGNIDGINEEFENRQEYIQAAINRGFDVELDVWKIRGDLFLGDDGPSYIVSAGWLLLRKNNIWAHAKNMDALDFLIELDDTKVFYHQQENHVVIGNTKLIWSHSIEEATDKSIIPLLSMNDIERVNLKEKNVYGICSDFVSIIQKIL